MTEKYSELMSTPATLLADDDLRLLAGENLEELRKLSADIYEELDRRKKGAQCAPAIGVHVWCEHDN
jgi:hypothetical protein